MSDTPALNEYRCTLCHNVYTKAWSDEEARAEMQSYWPGVAQEECAVICDDCWQKIHPEWNLSEYESSLTDLWVQQALQALYIPPEMIGNIHTTNRVAGESQERAYREKFDGDA